VAVSSLTTLSLQRVTTLASAALGPNVVDPEVFIEVYARITVQVLSELGLIGAVVCGLALIPAALGLRHSAPAAVTGSETTQAAD
jgi:hypothetical protein